MTSSRRASRRRLHPARWYGARQHEEWRRLEQDGYHQLEQMVTSHFLHKHLPRHALILDAGGGPGRYAVELAKAGHDLVLLDIVPEMVELARAKARQAHVTRRFLGFHQGSIVDLSAFDDATFDAVLCLGGPLSHVLHPAQRVKAVRELVRVARRGAPIFVSVISRLGLLRAMLTRFPDQMRHAMQHWETGDYVPGVNGEGFTAAHWFLPEELRALFEKQDVDVFPPPDFLCDTPAMKPFTHLTGTAAPLPIANIDTDQIIPKQFLKTVSREGLSKGLFFDFKTKPDGTPDPDFVLNKPAYARASILIAKENFGCGSSREHAPWALLDQGLTVVIAPSFADIFYNNCFKNGLLPVVLPRDVVDQLMEQAGGPNHMFSIDLAAQTVVAPDGKVHHFDIDQGRKASLLAGLDDIGETLERSTEISAFEDQRRLSQPWLA